MYISNNSLPAVASHAPQKRLPCAMYVWLRRNKQIMQDQCRSDEPWTLDLTLLPDYSCWRSTFQVAMWLFVHSAEPTYLAQRHLSHCSTPTKHTNLRTPGVCGAVGYLACASASVPPVLHGLWSRLLRPLHVRPPFVPQHHHLHVHMHQSQSPRKFSCWMHSMEHLACVLLRSKGGRSQAVVEATNCQYDCSEASSSPWTS
jgi:hypothetical protein